MDEKDKRRKFKRSSSYASQKRNKSGNRRPENKILENKKALAQKLKKATYEVYGAVIEEGVEFVIPQPEIDNAACAITGEPLDDPYSAIADPENGTPTNFDSVLQKIKEQESLPPETQLCYIGSGRFGILERVEKTASEQENQKKQSEEKSGTILKFTRVIPYEGGQHRPQWRTDLATHIVYSYVPSPRPLSELYTEEEIIAFPQFNRVSK